MDRPNHGSVTIEEVAMILGQKEIELFALRKAVAALQQRVAELEKLAAPQ